MAFPECNSSDLLTLIPCYKCLSMDDILAIKAMVLCQIVAPEGVTCTDPESLRSHAACLACIGDEDLERLEVAGLCAFAATQSRDRNCDPATLLDEAKCLRCLPPHDLRAIYKWLFCKWLESQAALLQ